MLDYNKKNLKAKKGIIHTWLLISRDNSTISVYFSKTSIISSGHVLTAPIRFLLI